MLKEEIKNIKESKKDLRKFGLTVGLALLAIGIVLFTLEKPAAFYFGGTGSALILLGLIYPNILKPLNKVWMTIALVLGWFMSRVILIILFYLVLTPLGLIAKLFGKDFLDLKIEKNSSSYWIKREKTKVDPADLERQF